MTGAFGGVEAATEAAVAALDGMSDTETTVSVLNQPDRRDGSVYRVDPQLLLALKAALVTGRPLLLQGPAGSGKSSIAAYVARNLSWRYYEHVVSAQTEPKDLLWNFDLVRRLADAQVRKGEELRDEDYVNPGVLWWALNPASAKRRGVPVGKPMPTKDAVDPNEEVNQDRSPNGAVVLIDEIDKAEPDVPGGLLVPLGSFRFTVSETGAEVRSGEGASSSVSRLIILTSNDDRELAWPFLRRCVVHRLRATAPPELVEIAKRHLKAEGRRLTADQEGTLQMLANRVAAAQPPGDGSDTRGPSTAEYLDAVRAALSLGDRLTPQDWDFVERLLLAKEGPAR